MAQSFPPNDPQEPDNSLDPAGGETLPSSDSQPFKSFVNINQKGKGNSAENIIGSINVEGDAYFSNDSLKSFLLHASKILETKAFRVSACIAATSPILLWLASPKIADFFNERGLAYYQDESLPPAERRSQALKNYYWGLNFNSDNPGIHFNIGLLYEDFDKPEEAILAYETAIQGGLTEAYNNLARLYIRQEEYDTAIGFLNTTLDSTEYQSFRPIDVYNFYKNLGWARWGMGRYQEAEEALAVALEVVKPLEEVKDSEIIPKMILNRASADCILAQVLEAQGRQVEAYQHWQICLDQGNPQVPEEDEWLGLARQRLAP